MLEGVLDQVDDDALQPALVGVDDEAVAPGASRARAAGRRRPIAHARCPTSRGPAPVGRGTAPRSTGSITVSAAWASRRLISRRSSTSWRRRVMSLLTMLDQAGDLGRAGGRVGLQPGLEQRGLAHQGRDRGAELVGDVGHEAALAGLSGLQVEHLGLQVLGHLVERGGQHAELVGPGRQADVQVAVGHLHRRPARLPAPGRSRRRASRYPAIAPSTARMHPADDEDVAQPGQLGQALALGVEEVDGRLARPQLRRPPRWWARRAIVTVW